MVTGAAHTYARVMDWVVAVLVVAVVLVVAAERLTVRGRGLPSRPPTDGAGAGMLGELVDVFQPSRTHLTQERERQRTTIVQRPATAPPLDVDLEAGEVRITPAEQG